MGSELSAFVVEPLMGIGIVALAIMAIIKENQNEQSSAKWFAIGSTALTLILIVLNIILSAFL